MPALSEDAVYGRAANRGEADLAFGDQNVAQLLAFVRHGDEVAHADVAGEGVLHSRERLLELVLGEEGRIDDDFAGAAIRIKRRLVGQRGNALDDEADLLRRQGVRELLLTTTSQRPSVSS